MKPIEMAGMAYPVRLQSSTVNRFENTAAASATIAAYMSGRPSTKNVVSRASSIAIWRMIPTWIA